MHFNGIGNFFELAKFYCITFSKYLLFLGDAHAQSYHVQTCFYILNEFHPEPFSGDMILKNAVFDLDQCYNEIYQNWCYNYMLSVIRTKLC